MNVGLRSSGRKALLASTTRSGGYVLARQDVTETRFQPSHLRARSYFAGDQDNLTALSLLCYGWAGAGKLRRFVVQAQGAGARRQIRRRAAPWHAAVPVWARRGSRARATPSRSLPPANYLAVSGGSDNGAFAAGLLVGWSESGTRPSSKLVTGISTSTLVAPFFVSGGAPIGADRDPHFRRFSRRFQ